MEKIPRVLPQEVKWKLGKDYSHKSGYCSLYKCYRITCSFFVCQPPQPPPPRKWYFSESLSKYASFIGKMGFVDSIATEVHSFQT